MKEMTGSLMGSFLSVLLFGSIALPGETPPPAAPIFPDKNLEAAVRKFVFEKRDNDKPLAEADLVNLSTIQAVGLGITNLTGLEKCQSLASLDLSKNKISNLQPLKSLARIQYLNLAENQIEDLAPLGEIPALQYIELSQNRVKVLKPLGLLTNLASLYLSHNQISEIAPVVKLPRLVSLYLDHNQIKSIPGINGLKSLSSLSLNNNAISDLAPLEGLTGLYFLSLEHNKIRDLGVLLRMAKNDHEQRFAPFINIYLAGNPLGSAAKRNQIPGLKEIGAKIFN